MCLIINFDKIFFRDCNSYEENLKLNFSVTTIEIIMLVFWRRKYLEMIIVLLQITMIFLYTGLRGDLH